MQNKGNDLIDGLFSVDQNGDLVMDRRKRSRLHDVQDSKNTISIHHLLKTRIPYVGLQIWKGALLLSDFLLHKMQSTDELDNVTVLELGSGTGLVGIVMARKALLTFLTDYGMDILDNCYRNVILNSHGNKGNMGILRVRQLDWNESWPPRVSTVHSNMSDNNDVLQYTWLESDLEELEHVSILLASDVIYSNNITDAFFSVIEKLMLPGSKKVLWLALEKRINFSLSDLDVVAHGYDHFRSFLKNAEEGRDECYGEDSKQFVGRKIELDQIPQYINGYERTSDLELWEIWR